MTAALCVSVWHIYMLQHKAIFHFMTANSKWVHMTRSEIQILFYGHIEYVHKFEHAKHIDKTVIWIHASVSNMVRKILVLPESVFNGRFTVFVKICQRLNASVSVGSSFTGFTQCLNSITFNSFTNTLPLCHCFI